MKRITPLMLDLMDLNTLADKLLGDDFKDGKDEKRRLSELEKRLLRLKQLIAKALELLTAKPKDKAEEMKLKRDFEKLSKEIIALLEEIEELLQLSNNRDTPSVKDARRKFSFLINKKLSYSRARVA